MRNPGRGTTACDPQQAADLLRALAHPMRLRILCRLLDGELSVSGFESELGLKQPNLSQQLGHLREAALVATRREAKSIFYSLADERVRGILDALRVAMGTQAPAPNAAAAPIRPSPGRPAPRPEPAATPRPESAGAGMFSVAGWPGGVRPGRIGHG